MPSNPHPSPTIALITDYGHSDWYVGAMKGVIAGIAPDAATVDITHDIPLGDVGAAAFVLSQCFHNFPRRTVFLCVVDPGVGTGRRPLILYTGDYFFVAPDNGLLTLVRQGLHRAFEIDPTKLRNPAMPSRTFHGRDIFAPAAAWLAHGETPQALGKPVNDIEDLGFAFQLANHLPIDGEFVHFDHFGNGISNLVLDHIKPRKIVLEDGMEIPFAETFASVPAREPVAYLGSGGLVEIAVNQGSAREALKLARGMGFRLA